MRVIGRFGLGLGFGQGAAGSVNLIGIPGTLGFGGGIAPALPSGFAAVAGNTNPAGDTYANYEHVDGGTHVYRPKGYYRIGHADNPTYPVYGVNSIDIKGVDTFPTTAAANAAGYALGRPFIDGGVEKDGYFTMRYQASKKAKGTGFVATSVKNALPLSTSNVHNQILDITAAGANAYYAAINAAKGITGANGILDAASPFFCESLPIKQWEAMLSLAHGQAATSTAVCAWYDANGVTNFPKGCNNNALKDANDTVVTWESDGYSNCGKTGSAGFGGGAGNVFAKSTVSGQPWDVADRNGLMWEIAIGMTAITTSPAIAGMTQANPCVVTVTGHGLTSGDPVQVNSITQADWVGAKDKIYAATVIDENTFSIAFDASAFATPYDAGTDPGTVTIGTFYAAKESTTMTSFTSGSALATDHWGATGVAALMEEIAFPFVSAGGFGQRWGSAANQVFSEAVSGAGYQATGFGLPKDGNGLSAAGSSLMGQDYYYQYLRNELCPLVSGNWGGSAVAGVWCRYWYSGRTYSSYDVGFRCACYL